MRIHKSKITLGFLAVVLLRIGGLVQGAWLEVSSEVSVVLAVEDVPFRDSDWLLAKKSFSSRFPSWRNISGPGTVSGSDVGLSSSGSTSTLTSSSATSSLSLSLTSSPSQFCTGNGPRYLCRWSTDTTKGRLSWFLCISYTNGLTFLVTR